jgi:hypothetical protein
MRSKLSKIALAAIFGIALALTFSCSSEGGGKEETYYIERGGVSVKADDLIYSTPGLSAADAISILNQYPVIGDKYKVVKFGVSRAELEKELNEMSMSISGFSKEQFLNLLNTNGRALVTFSNRYNDLVYIYVQKE